MDDAPQYDDDILKIVSDDEFEKLKRIYKNQTSLPHASNVLSNAKRLREKGHHLITLLCPRDEKEDGTFFALLEFGLAYALAVFTLDETGETVLDCLTKTKRIEFERPVSFYSIHNSINATIEQVVKNRKMKIKEVSAAYTYSIPKEEALLFEIECPEDVEIRPIESHHSDIIHSGWSFSGYPGSYEYVRCLIKHLGGVGLFLKSTNEPVAWVLRNPTGELGLLHTVEKHRNKGFASIVMKELSRQIAQEEDVPTTSVLLSNAISKNLVEKLGFTNLGVNYWSYLEKGKGSHST